MICNMGNNGGVVLNYKIIGSPSVPLSPRENTFWINTSIKITDCIFSSKKPTGDIKEGTVWIMTSNNGNIKVNFLKKNYLYIYPIYCEQYISNQWSEKTVQIYMNDSWLSLWTGQLFDNGNQYEHYSGGWECNREPDGYHTNEAMVGNCIVFNTAYYGEEYSSSDIYVYTKDMVDITNYSKLKIEVVSDDYKQNAEYGYIRFGIGTSSAKFSKYQTLERKNADPNTGVGLVNGIHSFDISTYRGEYYIILSSSGTDSSISKVWLEP